MKKIVGLCIVGLLSLNVWAAQPELLVVKFHADWCGSCKALDPVVEDLTNKFDGSAVLFVELDRTNQTSSNHAALLASALGLESLYNENSGTGFILLVDSESGESVAKLSKMQSAKEMAQLIKDALK